MRLMREERLGCLLFGCDWWVGPLVEKVIRLLRTVMLSAIFIFRLEVWKNILDLNKILVIIRIHK